MDPSKKVIRLSSLPVSSLSSSLLPCDLAFPSPFPGLTRLEPWQPHLTSADTAKGVAIQSLASFAAAGAEAQALLPRSDPVPRHSRHNQWTDGLAGKHLVNPPLPISIIRAS